MDALSDRDNPLRRVPRLYGKVQAKHAARWLTHDEAFGDLLITCRATARSGCETSWCFASASQGSGRPRSSPCASVTWSSTMPTRLRHSQLELDDQEADAQTLRRCEGLTRASLEDISPGAVVEPGRYVVVGDEDADPAVARVVDVKANGIVLLRVLPGHLDQHLDLLGRGSV